MTSPAATAEAMAVSAGRVIAVGKTSEIRKHISPSTKVINAEGRLVLPGFNDAHVHFMAIGNTFSTIDLRYVTTASGMTERIAHYVRFLPEGRWILGGRFRQDASWIPNMAAIDAITPATPVFLYRSDPATAFANTLAFKSANLNDDSTGVERDADGKATGIVSGPALQRIASAVPKNHMTNWAEVGETATNYAASLGVTSVQDMHSDDSRAIYLELQRVGKLRTRVYDCLPIRDWSKLKSTRLQQASNAMVSDGCLKGFSDGDEEPKATLAKDVSDADKAGLQVMVHAIGKSANRIVLDVFEQVANSNGPRDRRFRVEHANADDVDLPRFKRLNIIASMQPFLFDGGSGSKFGTLLKQGAAVAFGSDASMVELNPLLGIDAAVNAADGNGISVYDAVRAYTVTSSFAEFKEKQKGTIAPGMLADIVILSDDIFKIGRSKIRDAKVVVTVVNGAIVFDGRAVDRTTDR